MIETQFVTFYSYKGGVGRTLALGNIAWEAALRGKKVVLLLTLILKPRECLR